jgi:hypothetical protein
VETSGKAGTEEEARLPVGVSFPTNEFNTATEAKNIFISMSGSQKVALGA